MLWAVACFVCALQNPYVTLRTTEAHVVAGHTPRIRIAYALQNNTSAELQWVALRVQYLTHAYTTYVALSTQAFSEQQGTFENPLAFTSSPVQHIDVQLVSYSLAHPTVGDLWQLFDATSALEQRSLCDTFGLYAPQEQRMQVREKWQSQERTVHTLIQDLFAPMPRKVSQKDMLWRLFITRALGVVGTPEAVEALRKARMYQPFEAYQELLPVVRIAHLEGTPHTAPLFFLWPENSFSWKDVADTALKDASYTYPAHTPHVVSKPKDVRSPPFYIAVLKHPGLWIMVAFAMVLGVLKRWF